MPDTISPPSVAPPARGLAARVIGVLTSPRAAYADVAARPSWLGGLLVVLVATSLPVMALLSTQVGQRAAVDQQLQTLESYGFTVTDEQYQQIERIAPYARYITPVAQFVGLPVTALVIAGVVFAIFNGGLAADATFRQVFAVVSYSGVLLGLRTVFSTPLNYAGETFTSPTNLAAVLPFFGDNTFGARLLGSIDLFLIWWTVNLAIGLAVLYKRPTAPIATTMLIVYGGIALTIATLRSTLAGA